VTYDIFAPAEALQKAPPALPFDDMYDACLRGRCAVADGSARCVVCDDAWHAKEKGDIIFCDRDGCNKAYHTLSCLDPPLETIPDDEWFCPDCAV